MNSPRGQHRRHSSANRRTSTRSIDSSNPLADILGSDLFQQLAPLVFIFVVPLFVLVTNKYKHTLFSPFRFLIYQLTMVLEVLSGALPWNWYSGSRDRKAPEKKKAVRTRAEQLESTNGAATDGASIDSRSAGRTSQVQARVRMYSTTRGTHSTRKMSMKATILEL